MADRDRLPRGLSPKYRKPYRQVLEWKLKPEAIADTVVAAFKKDLDECGDEPLKFISQVTAHFERAMRAPLFAPSWFDLGTTVDALANHVDTSQIGTECARAACKEQITLLRNGEKPRDLKFSMVLRYLLRLYRVRFEDAVPQPAPNKIPHEELVNRLRLLQPFMFQHLRTLARRIARTPSVKRIRLPRRLHKPIVENETDLEKIGV